jgi:NAD(P)-dependent dehydrogenase (short-subunit alcohol dehydrogenase family)
MGGEGPARQEVDLQGAHQPHLVARLNAKGGRRIDAAQHPITLYAATKLANESMAHAYAHLFRIPSTGFRFFTVYGPWGRPDMALFKFTEAILAGRPIDVIESRAHQDVIYSPVPEPSTWMLMIAGLVATARIARPRRSGSARA